MQRLQVNKSYFVQKSFQDVIFYFVGADLIIYYFNLIFRSESEDEVIYFSFFFGSSCLTPSTF